MCCIRCVAMSCIRCVAMCARELSRYAVLPYARPAGLHLLHCRRGEIGEGRWKVAHIFVVRVIAPAPGHVTGRSRSTSQPTQTYRRVIVT